MSTLYSIRAVAEQTGLSVHTIRAWERRYGVPVPLRTESNRRVYGEEDVHRLKSLQRAVESGHSIGLIASLPVQELVRLANSAPQFPGGRVVGERYLEECQRALLTLNAEGFQATLVRASSVLGVDQFLTDLTIPLIAYMGEEWSQGRLNIAQEHMASAQLRSHLQWLCFSIQADQAAPRIVVGTPSGQHHELGALIAALIAARSGWNVTYLGPNLPAKEIALAAARTRASSVALSLVYPVDDPGIASELKSLRSDLDPAVQILVGGNAVQNYAAPLEAINAHVCEDLEELRSWLSARR